ncbi:MAG: DUF2125 domain-containing protein [Roseicyclus sp.]
MLGKWVRGLGVTVAALAVLGSGAWGLGAVVTERAIADWLAARAGEGWLVNYADIAVGGYPTAFETRIEELELADPETGWLWSLPVLRLESPALEPGRLLVVLPPEQGLASPGERLTVTSGAMTSALELRPRDRFALDLSETALREVRVESSTGWVMTLPEGRLGVTRQEGREAAYDVSFAARGLTPPPGLRAVLDPADLLPEAIGTLDYRAGMAFDRPWDLRAIAERRPQITALDLRELNAVWGGLVFRAAGRLDVDAAGLPEGELALRAENWREMVAMAARAGLIPQGLQGTAEGLLEVLAGLSGDPGVIDARLRFAEGRMFLGPLPLGPAPVLRLR